MLTIENTGVRITRGDSARFVIRLAGRELPDGTRARLTVKRDAWPGRAAVLEKELPVMDGCVHVVLTPAETDLDTGRYAWDLRLLTGGEVITPMRSAQWDIMEAIGHGNE